MYYRIKKNNEFQKMFTRGKKSFSLSLLMLYLPATKISLGLCVSKKHGNSVRRNRIKRLLREAFRSECDSIDKPCSIILIPKQAEDYTFGVFKKHIRVMLKREGLIR